MFRPLYFLCLLFFCAGCAKQGPPPLTLDESPAAITKAFQTASMQVKKNAEAVAAMIKEKHYAGASIQLQALLSNTGISKEQRDVLSAASIAVNEVLQTIAATAAPEMALAEEPGGAPKPPAPAVSEEEAKAAAAAVEHYRMTK
jgi:hypothetical protein